MYQLRIGWALLIAAVLAVGVPSISSSAALATSSSTPTWTKLHPAAHPHARYGAAVAYDAATGKMVLFGGLNTNSTPLGDTWTWNGTTWTQLHPATSPPARWGASMAYDAATGNVVLFGGYNSQELGDTWIWNGTTWTQQAPATSPPARYDPSMAYDAATSTVVLFGGVSRGQRFGDTWTWDGTTWTQQAPATSPPARDSAAMAYDAATRSTLLFGGESGPEAPIRGDTWVWDGTTWTQLHPAAHPHARYGATVAYDAATGNVVLFGGFGFSHRAKAFSDTWTWDGTTWTQLHPAAQPDARDFAAMAYDAATSTVIMFGGYNDNRYNNDVLRGTWTWPSG